MRADYEKAGAAASEAIQFMRITVSREAEVSSTPYEDIVRAAADRLHAELNQIDTHLKVPPGTALAVAMLQIRVRI